jgi:hypothetical protein
MYISQLVKTRSPHSGLLIHRHPVSLISLAAHLHVSSSSFHLSSLISYLSFPLHLLLVNTCGSAASLLTYRGDLVLLYLVSED